MTPEQIIEIIYNHISQNTVHKLNIVPNPQTEQPILITIFFEMHQDPDLNAIGPILSSLQNTALLDNYDLIEANIRYCTLSAHQYIEIHTTFER